MTFACKREILGKSFQALPNLISETAVAPGTGGRIDLRESGQSLLKILVALRDFFIANNFQPPNSVLYFTCLNTLQVRLTVSQTSLAAHGN